MTKTKDILIDFINVWSDQNQIYSKQCVVSSIDADKRICTCSPIDGGADILEVRLESDITINSDGDAVNSNPKGFFVVPEVDSLVVVTFLSKTEAFLSAYTEISDVIAIQDQFTFNDGAYGGLIKISDLVDRLNDYEDLFNQLKTDFNSWTPVPQDGGLALKTILSAGFLTKVIPSSNVSEFENGKVKH